MGETEEKFRALVNSLTLKGCVLDVFSMETQKDLHSCFIDYAKIVYKVQYDAVTKL